VVDDPLPSWRAGETKESIVSFVRSVSDSGAGWVPPADRIATFDNDGTLWCEKPLYIQAAFIFGKWHSMAAADPSLQERQPYKALVEGDRQWLAALLDHVPDLVRGVSEAFSGITTDEFEQQVAAFFASEKHPTLGRPYTDLAYQPMKELLDYLRANEFRVFICSGGGRDFVRVVSEDVYGIAREQVIGSSAPVELRDGVLVRTPGVEQPVDDGPGKPVHIWARTGRRPLLAGGNADGDIEMLGQARFALLVHHDDPEREFAYDEGAERALVCAKEDDWTVASMARDFAAIF